MRNTNLRETNVAELTGVLNSPMTFSHEVYGETFYEGILEVQRSNPEASDKIKIVVSDRVDRDVKNYEEGSLYNVKGRFSSRNTHDENGGTHLSLFLLAHSVTKVSEEDLENLGSTQGTKNTISLKGYITKEPVYRQTPLGREITDLLLAVNRNYGKSDYIPLIVWGRNAVFAKDIEIGTCIQVTGRMQSRTYTKKLGDGTQEERVAYEVSCGTIKILEEPVQHEQGSED